MSYAISEWDGTGSVSGTGILDASGSFRISAINVSSLMDGAFDVSVWLTDLFENRSAAGTGIAIKSTQSMSTQTSFLSGSAIASYTTSLRITTNKTVDYSVSGTGLIDSVTGSIIGS